MGLAITDKDGNLLYSEVISIKACGGIDKVAEKVLNLCKIHDVHYCGLERFVPFKNLFTKVAEEVLLLIGGLWVILKLNGISVELFRSIEWKSALCKYLVKESGFNNPSTSFDKVYSKAIASHITKIKISNDHISDAIGLSTMWKVRQIQ